MLPCDPLYYRNKSWILLQGWGLYTFLKDQGSCSGLSTVSLHSGPTLVLGGCSTDQATGLRAMSSRKPGQLWNRSKAWVDPWAAYLREEPGKQSDPRKMRTSWVTGRGGGRHGCDAVSLGQLPLLSLGLKSSSSERKLPFVGPPSLCLNGQRTHKTSSEVVTALLTALNSRMGSDVDVCSLGSLQGYSNLNYYFETIENIQVQKFTRKALKASSYWTHIPPRK